MQPALRDVVQYFTVPASAATAGDRFAAIRSFPSCAPPDRGAPKSLMYCTWPTSGKTMWSGTFGAAARAVPATRPMIAARKRTPRAVVRWRLIRERALRFASEGSEPSSVFGGSFDIASENVSEDGHAGRAPMPSDGIAKAMPG